MLQGRVELPIVESNPCRRSLAIVARGVFLILVLHYVKFDLVLDMMSCCLMSMFVVVCYVSYVIYILEHLHA